MKSWCLGRSASCVAVCIALAGSAVPASTQPPDDTARKTIEKKLGQLGDALHNLRADAANSEKLASWLMQGWQTSKFTTELPLWF